MSSSRALCCVPSMKKQKNDLLFLHSMYNKIIIRFGFCDFQNNQGLGKGPHPQPSASADNPYLSITKFSIVIGSQRAYLPRNRRAITRVSNYRYPI